MKQIDIAELENDMDDMSELLEDTNEINEVSFRRSVSPAFCIKPFDRFCPGHTLSMKILMRMSSRESLPHWTSWHWSRWVLEYSFLDSFGPTARILHVLRAVVFDN